MLTAITHNPDLDVLPLQIDILVAEVRRINDLLQNLKVKRGQRRESSDTRDQLLNVSVGKPGLDFKSPVNRARDGIDRERFCEEAGNAL